MLEQIHFLNVSKLISKAKKKRGIFFMAKNNKKIQNLIDICEDAREFYTDATDQTKDSDLKKLFRTMADIRKGIIIDLRAHMRQSDMNVAKPSETTMGQVNKFLGEKISSWSDNPDAALIAYLEEAEDRCLHAFQDLLKDDDIDSSTQIIVAKELETLKRTHDYMKELKEVTSMAA